MPSLIPDFATLEKRLAGLPVVKHRAREQTGGLLFLRSGTVEVVKDGVQIASVNAPGAVFVAVKRQIQTGEPRSVIGKAVAKVEELLSYGGRDPTGW
jgi:hypothetical protein